MSIATKYVAEVIISDPTAVAARCASLGAEYDKGAIFVSIPEAAFEGTELVYCRNGLSIPYFKVQEGWKVLVEPTINYERRWFYTGICDTGTTNISPTAAEQMIFQTLLNTITIGTDGSITFDSSGAGLYIIRNAAESFKTLIDALIDEIKAIQTFGSPPTHTVSPASQAALDLIKTRIATLWGA